MALYTVVVGNNAYCGDHPDNRQSTVIDGKLFYTLTFEDDKTRQFLKSAITQAPAGATKTVSPP